MALDTPRSLRLFLIVASLLTIFMFLNILTTARYLHSVFRLAGAFKVNPTRAHFANATRVSVMLPSNATGDAKAKPITLVSPGSKAPSPLPVLPATTKKAEPTARPELCKECFGHNFRYLLQNESICKLYDESQSIDIMTVIFTVHGNLAARNAIRETWASPAKHNTANIRYAFLLGDTGNAEVKAKVMEEAKVHGDIIMEDFKDSYNNLTYKTMMGFKWITRFCNHTKYFVKTDDDMWVNFRALLKLLRTRGKELETAVGGACMLRAGPIRDPRSKWYASKKSYPQTSYPGFCSGTGYASTPNVAKKVFEISASVPFFHLEDVYVALCIKKLGYKLLPLPGFHNYRTKLDPCDMQSDRIITSHQIPTNFLHTAFDKKC